jgi:NFU1 iron-sulfur cluster scaffold homolog, mitochondrial
MTDAQDIKITGEPTLDPQVCKFVVSRPLLEEGSFACRDRQTAEGSPLLESLFAIEGITQIMVSGNTVTVAKNTPEPWPVMGPQIGNAIRGAFASDKPLIDESVQKRPIDEERLQTEIERLFDEYINPQIASHGGRVELAEVKGTKVYVRLGGGCQGCASANVTLKHGIEQAIRQRLPEVTEVIDVTNHAAGTDPYYT